MILRAGLLVVTAGLIPGKAAIASGDEIAPTGHDLPAPARAKASVPPTPDETWARRFPQPVLVSDLIGRLMLDRDQGVLGWIRTLVRTPDGEILIAFARRRFLLFQGEIVTVPEHATALLGPFVMILDRTAVEIENLPAFDVAGSQPVDQTSKIRMALTKH